jgi:hypothetical protein
VEATGTLPAVDSVHAIRLTVSLLGPTGLVAGRETLEWPSQSQAGR